MLLNLYEIIAFIAPVYAANAAPVLVGGGLPLDLDRTFIDGKPIFGSNKTIKGTVGGLAFGWAVSGLISALLGAEWLLLGFSASIGSLAGDLGGSFVKRRIGLKAGAQTPLLDQLDFLFGALLLSLVIKNLSLATILLSILLTPPIHLLSNFLAFKSRLKEVPW